MCSSSTPTLLGPVEERVFTTVVVCETGILRSGESVEFGPVGLLLFRTAYLPLWARSISYHHGELHVKEEDGPGALEELRHLIEKGDAMILKNVTFVHTVAPVGRQMVSA